MHSSSGKKERRTPLATKNNNVSASELQKTPPTLKPYFELKHSERTNRNIEIKRKNSEVASSLKSDITSIKVELEFHNGKKKYFHPRTPTSDHDESSECASPSKRANMHVIGLGEPNLNPNAIYSSENITEALQQMLTFLSPQLVPEPSNVFTIVHHNTEGLQPHLSDVKAIIERADVICFTDMVIKTSHS
ncbi:Hypothetical predicted protein [Mytilus galloprovincialis]|uniref:Uncharacterized protein n=1 Tax=Mytilus galloprovincialis TaxID=29158 RepID=A0A8B6DQS9_MYTGA|nr:Hypothetical predicted protein [Mytilus galloprovincialis]